MTTDNDVMNTDGSFVEPVVVRMVEVPAVGLSLPEQIAKVMADVDRIKVLKDELTETVESVRAQQADLAKQGCVLSFPVLDAAPSELEVLDPNLTIAHPVIPPRTDEETRQHLVEPEDNELSSHAETRVEPQDIRPEAQVQKDAFVNPDAAEVSNFQTKINNDFERVVSQGFASAESNPDVIIGG